MVLERQAGRVDCHYSDGGVQERYRIGLNDGWESG